MAMIAEIRLGSYVAQQIMNVARFRRHFSAPLAFSYFLSLYYLVFLVNNHHLVINEV